MSENIKKQSNILMIGVSMLAILLVVSYFSIKPTYSVCEYEDGNYFCYDDDGSGGGSSSQDPGWDGSGGNAPPVVNPPSDNPPSDNPPSDNPSGGDPCTGKSGCEYYPEDGSYSITDGNTRYNYDSNGKLLSTVVTGNDGKIDSIVTEPGAGSGLIDCTGSSCYFENGSTGSESNDKSSTKTETYEDGSKAIIYNKVDGSSVRKNYDSNGNLQSTVMTDKYGNVTRIDTYENSALQNVITTVSPSQSDDGSYQTTQNNDDGSKIVRNYDKNGNLLSTVTYATNGTITIKAETGSNSGLLDTNDVIYYKDEATCKSLSGGNCTKIGTTYVNTEQTKGLAYYTQNYCEKVTGDVCKSIVLNGETYYVAEDCNCENGCVVQPSSGGNSGAGSGGETGGGSGGTAAPGTVVYPNGSSNNTTSNPQTGSLGIFIAWVVALGALVYSFYYFKKTSQSY